MNEFEKVEEGYESNAEELIALYILAWLLIMKALGKLIRLPQNPSQNSLLKLERQVNEEVELQFSSLNKKVVAKTTEQIREAYIHGVQYARQSLVQETKLLELKEDDIAEIEKSLTDSHTLRMNKIVDETTEDLLRATHNTQDSVKRLVRKVVSKEMTDIGNSRMLGKNSQMATRIENQLREQFLANGIKDVDVAIIDKANRRWKLQTYSRMVAKTKMSYAYISAVREEALLSGSDLAIISTKPNTHDACLGYEGMIISLNGLTSGYLTYEQIKASKKCFHPNCGHFLRPVGGIDWIPKDLLEIHKKKMNQYNTQ